MLQTGLIPNAHGDLVTDATYDFYGLRLATCSLDQRIKIWQLDESTGNWTVQDDWKAHDAAVSKVSWAHPTFGSIIASSSFDRTVKIWEQVVDASNNGPKTSINGNGASPVSPSRWIERAVLHEARGTVRAVEFAPHHFGLKLATISSDNHLRIYECVEQPSLTAWHVSEEADVLNLPISTTPSFLSRTHTGALATPTQTSATLDGGAGASASLVAQALQQGIQQNLATGPIPPGRSGMGNREADGGWCISWCKDRYWGEVIAAGCGIGGTVKVIQISASQRPMTLLTLDPSPAHAASTMQTLTGSADAPAEADSPSPASYAVTSVAWAPSCGRSYHLIATGCRDGKVRIWKVKPAPEDAEGDEGEEGRWSATIVADFDNHKSSVGRVEWNITGTILSSAGNDGRIRLWKATVGNVWRPAGSLGVEQAQEDDQDNRESGDVVMDN
ncbi:hypothetical protein PC9H_007837 [Pleurotus ostreatus]|uniref:WD40 repeat-like protein n=1 Tax=Pleurotus ostreatus TaxID=5322 RepID=A0A8H6ZS18_PLEOS|nr:uncharacterized protein PC9H_007837 [Pleurotus ostreatus]KAF7428610.1 hypothetical protein PC9H_007837 [Pleurotus ostreatus]KAJ8696783.1 epoxide hydrolase, soluble (sEH) [Pleurotus ostreatus]